MHSISAGALRMSIPVGHTATPELSLGLPNSSGSPANNCGF